MKFRSFFAYLAVVAVLALTAAPLAANEPGGPGSVLAAGEGEGQITRSALTTRRSWGRTWAGVGLVAGGLAVMRESCDGLRIGNGCIGQTTWSNGSTTAGIGLAAAGALVIGLWSNVPVLPDVTPLPGGMRIGKTIHW